MILLVQCNVFLILMLVIHLRAKQISCQDYELNRPSIFYVEGSASISAPTTIGTVIFAVSRTNMIAQTSLQEVKQQIQLAINAITTDSVNFTTTGLKVYPEYETIYNKKTFYEEKQVFKGYKAEAVLTVRTSDLKIMGSIIDKGIEAGLDNLQSISFEIDPADRDARKNTLIEIAVKDAQARAKLALDPLGLEIVKVTSVSIDYYQPSSEIYNYQQQNNQQSHQIAGELVTLYSTKQKVEATVNVGFGVRYKNQVKVQVKKPKPTTKAKKQQSARRALLLSTKAQKR